MLLGFVFSGVMHVVFQRALITHLGSHLCEKGLVDFDLSENSVFINMAAPLRVEQREEIIIKASFFNV